jgi:hypothetical protein
MPADFTPESRSVVVNEALVSIALPVLWRGLEGGGGPRSLVIVSALLLCSALAACLPPVRRALAIEPAVAMKSE